MKGSFIKHLILGMAIAAVGISQTGAASIGFDTTTKTIPVNCPTDLNILMDAQGAVAKGGGITLQASPSVSFDGFVPSSAFSITIPHLVSNKTLKGAVVMYPGTFTGRIAYGTARVILADTAGSLEFLYTSKDASPNDMNVYGDGGQPLLESVSGISLIGDPTLPCQTPVVMEDNELASGFDQDAYIGNMMNLLQQEIDAQQPSNPAQYRWIALLIVVIVASLVYIKRRKSSKTITK